MGKSPRGKPTANALAYATLRAQGMTQYRAEAELGLSRGYGTRIEHKMPQVAKYLDSTLEMAKQSNAVRKAIMSRMLEPVKCKPCNGTGVVKLLRDEVEGDSNCPCCHGVGTVDVSEKYITAAERVSSRIQERLDPVIKKQEIDHTGRIFHEIPDIKPGPIDVTPKAKSGQELRGLISHGEG